MSSSRDFMEKTAVDASQNQTSAAVETSSTSGSLNNTGTTSKNIFSEKFNECDIKKLSVDYYGLEIKFGETESYPIKNTDFLKEIQGVMQLTDVFRPNLKFVQLNYPIKCTTMTDWLDLHVLLASANGEQKTKPKNLPAVILDCGGRKISIPVGGNRYSFDMGILPEYTVEFSPDEIRLYGNPKDLKTLQDHTEFGKNPLKKTLSYISYAEIIKNIKKHHGESYSSSVIATEVRRLLKGEKLSKEHSPYLPVLTCALFASEVARNPICMISGLMLLDLIEVEAKVPGGTDCFNWDNVLQDPGFHPMVHKDSWTLEFKNGKYYMEDPLNLSHIKTFIILAEWFKNYIKCAEVRVLNKEDYIKQYEIGLQNHVNHYGQFRNNNGGSTSKWKSEYDQCIRLGAAGFTINSAFASMLTNIDNSLLKSKTSLTQQNMSSQSAEKTLSKSSSCENFSADEDSHSEDWGQKFNEFEHEFQSETEMLALEREKASPVLLLSADGEQMADLGSHPISPEGGEKQVLSNPEKALQRQAGVHRK